MNPPNNRNGLKHCAPPLSRTCRIANRAVRCRPRLTLPEPVAAGLHRGHQPVKKPRSQEGSRTVLLAVESGNPRRGDAPRHLGL